MSYFVRNVSPVNSLHSVLRKNNFNVKKIEESLERDSSCINNANTYEEPSLCHVLRDKNCSSDVLRLVLKYGANVNVSCSVSSVTPLIAALEVSRDEEVIRLLLENGANVRISSRQSPLCIALHNDASKDVVQMLLDARCHRNGCAWHDSVLHCAIDNTRGELKEDVFHLLIERGANINAFDRDGRSVLCYALIMGAEEREIELLLSAGASLNACIRHGSALACATTVKADTVKLLLDKGARADEVDRYGYTPLQRALKTCDYNTKAVSLLLDCLRGEEANNVMNDSSRNLLHLAVLNKRCKPSVVELLIKRGFLVKAKYKNGATALHEAAMNQENTSVIKTLLKNGAAVNSVDLFGRTPFDLAVETWLSPDIVKVLLAAGARIGMRHDHALLKGVLDRICRPQRRKRSIVERDTRDCALLIMKYYFLEDPQFDFQSLVRSCKKYKAFSQFAEDCVLELQKIVSYNRTLWKVLGGYSLPQRKTAKRKRKEKRDFNHLLKKITDNEFPLFLEIVSVKVGRQPMDAKLREVQVYTRKCVPDTTCIGETIILNDYCVYAITQHLSDEDLMRLIVAFNYRSDHVCTSGQVSKEKNLGNKRSSEESAKCLKRVKLTPESQ